MNARQKRFPAWAVLCLLAVLALAVVAIPVFVIMPFKGQTPSGIAWSYLLRRSSPLLTATALCGAVALGVWLWRGVRWRGRLAVALLVAPLAAAAWFARQNHFEWMFNPLPKAEYVSVADARSFLVDAEMVMGIDVNGVSLAYPIRQLAYHHVVNEVVGGTPLVVTY